MRRSLHIRIGFNGRGCDRLHTVGLEWSSVVRSFEHGNEPSGSINGDSVP